MKYLLLLSTLALAACSSSPSRIDTSNTMDVIALSEASAPDSVKGIFKFHIKAAGKHSGDVFLNTEEDYRDRRSITVALNYKVVPELTKKYGESPETFFIDKEIEVTGEAKRVTIDFISQGRATNKYYYQTHVDVSSVEQIKVLN
ncbi:hypothetical protein L3Q70_07205 [Pseudoalteromonas sp. CF6-2]|uniref:hypothetical protein n=1 Tax=Pseudoalteromonas sp. CF6-2 TaxID=562716 RepID=UPI001F3E04B9|nr:hypothetical protein L3Q70_07205 [Pseudoalteromonas sp. CF6-2]